MDVYDFKTRSAVMRAVKSKNTLPEKKVRQLLHKAGYRYRLHRNDLPGKPDIVFPSRKSIVFVHGCFWHQHANCLHSKRPSSNTDYWNAKLNRNLDRDKVNIESLHAMGWRVFVLWECQISNNENIQQLKEFLG